MPIKIADHAVSVGAHKGRNDVAQLVQPGQPFDFTEAEIEDILRHQPDSLRDPVNETDVQSKAAPAKAGKAAGKTAGEGETL